MATVTTAGLPSGTFAIGDQLVGNQGGATKRLNLGTAGLSDVEGIADWTPILYGATTAGTTTYTSQLGKYYKLGNMVTLNFSIGWSNLTGTGDARIGNLPFTAATYSGTLRFGLVIAYFNSLSLPSETLQGYIQDGNNYITLLNPNGTTMNDPTDLQTEITTTGDMHGSITYLV